MERPCDVCGTTYEAKRSSSKYCSDTCRKRSQRGAANEPLAVIPLPVDEPETGPLEAATVAELKAVDRDKTTLGLAAVALARKVDTGRDTGAGMAALVKQLGATLSAATADVKSEQTPLDRARDELAARRSRSA